MPALLACHGLAFVALQLAFQRGGALATAGIATLWTNALPILAGMIIFGEPLPGGARGVARVAAFVAVVVGAALLARSGEEEAPKASDPQRKGPRIVAGVGAAVILLVSAGTVRASTDPPLANFRQIDQGSAGGTVWSGRIPNPFVPSDTRDTDVYLPPGLLGVDALSGPLPPARFLGSTVVVRHQPPARRRRGLLISAGTIRPFIAVMPPGGTPRRFEA